MPDETPRSEIILYQTQDGRTRIECRFENETIWLTQALIAELFQKDVRTINEPLTNIYDEAELDRPATIRKFRIVRIEGDREVSREIEHYPNAEISQRFFATVQNKMHWAAHGRTAAEVIHQRADAGRPKMGLKTTRAGGVIRKDDVSVAKNYLDEDELHALNRIVNAYLEFSELQAMNRRPMTMADWITKLDEFLKLSGRGLLAHAGKISADEAKAKAELEYERYRKRIDSQPRPVDDDLSRAVKEIGKRPKPRKPRKRKGAGEGGGPIHGS